MFPPTPGGGRHGIGLKLQLIKTNKQKKQVTHISPEKQVFGIGILVI